MKIGVSAILATDPEKADGTVDPLAVASGDSADIPFTITNNRSLKEVEHISTHQEPLNINQGSRRKDFKWSDNYDHPLPEESPIGLKALDHSGCDSKYSCNGLWMTNLGGLQPQDAIETIADPRMGEPRDQVIHARVQPIAI